jgi:hypothetical protein
MNLEIIAHYKVIREVIFGWGNVCRVQRFFLIIEGAISFKAYLSDSFSLLLKAFTISPSINQVSQVFLDSVIWSSYNHRLNRFTEMHSKEVIPIERPSLLAS